MWLTGFFVLLAEGRPSSRVFTNPVRLGGSRAQVFYCSDTSFCLDNFLGHRGRNADVTSVTIPQPPEGLGFRLFRANEVTPE